ncbi:MAG: phosphatidate cytidylyltransferase [Flavobacteriales bacterium]|nr:phosphatidate cytidylyltransferase [Flavobacteriales bacterium]
MSNLVKRILTGIIFLVVLIGGIMWNQYSFGGLFLVIMLLSLNEFYSLIHRKAGLPQRDLGLVLATVIYLTNYALATELYEYKILLINLPLLFMVFLHELFMDNRNPFKNIAYTFTGIIYIAIPFSILPYIYTFPEIHLTGGTSPAFIMGAFMILWTNDIMAFVVGSLFGRTRLFERISPKKSWEGALGGATFGWGMAYICSMIFHEFQLMEWLGLATVVVVFGTIGDLVESMFKRSIKVKDSGNILPGHGGMLDRFDGILIASPFILSYLILIS